MATSFTFFTEQLITDTVDGFTSQQQTLPASVDCADITLVSAAWDTYVGLGTFSWWLQRLQQGRWVETGLVGQFNQPLGIRGKNNVMPSIGVCRSGLGAMQTRVRFVPSVPVIVGITGVAT